MRNQQKSYSSNIYETSHMGSMQKAHCISLSIRLLVISLKFEPVHLHWLAGRAQASVSTIGRARHAALNIQLNRNRDRKGSSFTENARHQRTRVTRSDLPMHRRHLSGCLATLVCLLPTFVFSPSVSLSKLLCWIWVFCGVVYVSLFRYCCFACGLGLCSQPIFWGRGKQELNERPWLQRRRSK